MEFVLHFFRSSTVKVITLSKATKASSVVLFLFVSVCICFSLSLSFFLFAPRSFPFSPLPLIASPPPLSHAFSRPLLLFLLLSLSRSVSPRRLSLSLFLSVSISPFLCLSLSFSCCSSAAVLLTLGRQRAGETSPRPPKDWREAAGDETADASDTTDLARGKQDTRANATQIRRETEQDIENYCTEISKHIPNAPRFPRG